MFRSMTGYHLEQLLPATDGGEVALCKAKPKSLMSHVLDLLRQR